MMAVRTPFKTPNMRKAKAHSERTDAAVGAPKDAENMDAAKIVRPRMMLPLLSLLLQSLSILGITDSAVPIFPPSNPIFSYRRTENGISDKAGCLELML